MSFPRHADARDRLAEQVLLGEALSTERGIPGYSQLVLEHFRHPRHPGEFARSPDVVSGRAGSRAQGAEVAFSLLVRNGIVAGARFQAFGCPHFLAGASLATEELLGLQLPDLKHWRATGIGERLRFPVEKRGRLLILEDAVHAAVQNP